MRRRLAQALAVVVMGAATFASSPLAPAAVTSVRTFSPAKCATPVSPTYGQNCGTAFRAMAVKLRAGDTMRIAPGTYEIGDITIARIRGTDRSPITITAADPADRPLLQGRVQFRYSNFVKVSSIRFQATVPNLHALAFYCGTNWAITKSEIFGAAQTMATANLTISGRQPGAPNPDDGLECLDEPSNFVVAENYLHDPYTDPTLADNPDPELRKTASFYHNIYASFEGSVGTGGVVERNVFVGNRNGSGIKLGDGKYHTLGPWNVTVRFNTFYDGMRGIVLHDDVRNNLLTGNLIVKMNGGGGHAGPRVGVGVNRVYNLTNTLEHTYAYDLLKVWGATTNGSLLNIGVDNRLGTVDPAFQGELLEPTAPEVQPYGRWGTGAWPPS